MKKTQNAKNAVVETVNNETAVNAEVVTAKKDKSTKKVKEDVKTLTNDVETLVADVETAEATKKAKKSTKNTTKEEAIIQPVVEEDAVETEEVDEAFSVARVPFTKEERRLLEKHGFGMSAKSRSGKRSGITKPYTEEIYKSDEGKFVVVFVQDSCRPLHKNFTDMDLMFSFLDRNIELKKEDGLKKSPMMEEDDNTSVDEDNADSIKVEKPAKAPKTEKPAKTDDADKYKDIKNMEMYCIKCRCNHKAKNVKAVKSPKGICMIKGDCEVCGTNIFKVAKESLLKIHNKIILLSETDGDKTKRLKVEKALKAQKALKNSSKK